MTNSGGNSTLIHNGLLTSDRAVFVVVSATIIGVLVETGIIRVSGFVGVRDLSLDIAIFVGLGIFCVFSQLMILNFVRNKIGKSFLSHNRIGLLNKVIVHSSTWNYCITSLSFFGSFTYLQLSYNSHKNCNYE